MREEASRIVTWKELRLEFGEDGTEEGSVRVLAATRPEGPAPGGKA